MHLPHAIRDPIHGFIRLSETELRGLDSVELQRLRGISQLGLTERVYPGARHSRFEHALGTLEVATRMLEDMRGRLGVAGLLGPLELSANSSDFQHLVNIARWAALLHDLGHAPFSHVTEELLEDSHSHESWSRVLAEHGEVGLALTEAGTQLAADVLAVMDGQRGDLPLHLAFIRELISGPIGADRMDYLLRDSAATGVSYGLFDLGRVIHTIIPVRDAEPQVCLGLQRGGELAVEGLLWARFSMFQQVYFHRTRRILDRHLNNFLRAVLPGGRYPGERAAYLQWNDARVWELLRRASLDQAELGHRDAVRILRREHHRAQKQELESDDPLQLESWLSSWAQQVRQQCSSAEPLVDLVLPPPQADSGLDLSISLGGDSFVPLRERSSMLAQLRLRPLGRLYLAPGSGEFTFDPGKI